MLSQTLKQYTSRVAFPDFDSITADQTEEWENKKKKSQTYILLKVLFTVLCSMLAWG